MNVEDDTAVRKLYYVVHLPTELSCLCDERTRVERPLVKNEYSYNVYLLLLVLFPC